MHFLEKGCDPVRGELVDSWIIAIGGSTKYVEIPCNSLDGRIEPVVDRFVACNME